MICSVCSAAASSLASSTRARVRRVFRAEEFDAAAAPLGAIHGDVRLFHERLPVFRLPAQRHADAGVDLQAQPVELDRFVKCCKELLGGSDYAAVFGQPDEQGGKFVPTQTCQHGRVYQHTPHPRSDFLEEDIADVMAKRVVDFLEAIQVDQHDARYRAGLAGLWQSFIDRLVEVATIAQVGQIVPGCELCQGLLLRKYRPALALCPARFGKAEQVPEYHERDHEPDFRRAGLRQGVEPRREGEYRVRDGEPDQGGQIEAHHQIGHEHAGRNQHAAAIFHVVAECDRNRDGNAHHQRADNGVDWPWLEPWASENEIQACGDRQDRCLGNELGRRHRMMMDELVLGHGQQIDQKDDCRRGAQGGLLGRPHHLAKCRLLPRVGEDGGPACQRALHGLSPAPRGRWRRRTMIRLQRMDAARRVDMCGVFPARRNPWSFLLDESVRYCTLRLFSTGRRLSGSHSRAPSGCTGAGRARHDARAALLPLVRACLAELPKRTLHSIGNPDGPARARRVRCGESGQGGSRWAHAIGR